MRKVLYVTLIMLFLTTILSGCTESSTVEESGLAEDLYLEEAPGIRITADAMKALTAEGQIFTLSYIMRSS